MITHTARRLALAATLISLAALVALPGAALAAKKPPKPSLRIVSKAYTVKIAGNGNSVYLPDEQHVAPSCSAFDMPISMGIVSTRHHIVGAAFNWTEVSASVTGTAGAKTKHTFQVLCARNAKIMHVNSKKAVLNVGKKTMSASVQCPAGYTALGTAFPQAFAPGSGGISSMPGANQRSWNAVLNNQSPSTINQFSKGLGGVEPVVASAACAQVKMRTVKQRKFTLNKWGRATGAVSCPKNARPLSYGLDLGQFRRTSSRDGSWATPIVEKALLSATQVQFAFGMPIGVVSPSQPTTVHAKVICGQLKA